MTCTVVGALRSATKTVTAAREVDISSGDFLAALSACATTTDPRTTGATADGWWWTQAKNHISDGAATTRRRVHTRIHQLLVQSDHL